MELNTCGYLAFYIPPSQRNIRRHAVIAAIIQQLPSTVIVRARDTHCNVGHSKSHSRSVLVSSPTRFRPSCVNADEPVPTPRAVTTRATRVQHPQIRAVRCWKGEATLPEVGARYSEMSQPRRLALYLSRSSGLPLDRGEEDCYAGGNWCSC